MAVGGWTVLVVNGDDDTMIPGHPSGNSRAAPTTYR